MIILDKPYVSELLKDTISQIGIPVLRSDYSNTIQFNSELSFLSSEKAKIEYNVPNHPKIYSNSENAINWITQNLKNTNLPEKINLFKDKVRFRNLLSDLYPDFFYREIAIDKLEDLNVDSIPKPFIIKPSVGFFSMGVYKVYSHADWLRIPNQIKQEIENVKHLYPSEVLNAGKFIIEQMIEGDEYAFDVYFNEIGKPIVLGIFKHLFSSGDDVGDRIYYTSKEIILDKLSPFGKFAEQVGERADIRNFPMHIEVRISDKGELVPIEINPMRFGGWCTTADLTTHAFNLNPYKYYFNGLEPNWTELLKDKEGLNYCMIILDNTTGYNTNEIESFDYEAVKKRFLKPIDMRKTDWKEYPVFGILFTETPVGNYNEIESILKSDLKEFVTLK